MNQNKQQEIIGWKIVFIYLLVMVLVYLVGTII